MEQLFSSGSFLAILGASIAALAGCGSAIGIGYAFYFSSLSICLTL